MSDEPLTTCPTCGGEIHRVVYPVGLVFKGSGFYSTDNRKSGGNGATGATAASPASADSSSEGASGASGASETKSEANPGAKPETAAAKAKAATTE
jgi:hypothetical protein